MKKLIFSAIAVCLLSSCTALGFVADTVIIGTINKHPELSEVLESDLALTQLGVEIDAKIIANIKEANTSDASGKDTIAKSANQFNGLCDRELKEGEKCYTAEYYQQFRKDQ